jgi:signal transduction histidine kinase
LGGDMAEVNKRYVMNNIAEIHLSMDEYGQAEEMYRRCIDMLGEVDEADTASNLDLATYYQNLAEVRIAESGRLDSLTRAQKLDEAVSFAQRSLDLSQRYHDTHHKIINRLTALSKATFQSGETEEGLKLMEEALRIAKENDDVFMEAVIYVQRGQFESQLQRNADAERDFINAISIAEENHFTEVLQEALESVYPVVRQRDPNKALDYLERSMGLSDSIFNENQQHLIRDYQVRYAMQEKDHELALEQAKTRQNRMYVIVLAIIAFLSGVIAVIWYRLAKVRKKRNEELQRVNQTKDRLLSIVSHDVKTPVGAICTVLRQMTNHYDAMSDTDRKANLVMMRSSAEGLDDRVRNIMQWVRGELENSEIRRNPFNLCRLADDCIKMQMAAADAKTLKVVNEVEPSLTVNDDENAVSLVLQNLLSNAVKFSYPNGEVGISAEAKGGCVWVTVTDNGMGISEKKMEKIFRYMTSSSKGTGGETGTGIGLFVTKELLDKIGGEISIESQKDSGTRVRFSLRAGLIPNIKPTNQ